MGEWSPECRQVEWLDGSDGPTVGATFIGHNKGGPGGLMKWSRRGRVLTADPGREFAFVTEEGGRESTEWRYHLEPLEGGTRVTESYTVHWIPTWARIVDVPTNRVRELRRRHAAHARAAEGCRRGDAVGPLAEHRTLFPPSSPEESVRCTPTRPRPTSTS